jgi:hypothetical protein
MKKEKPPLPQQEKNYKRQSNIALFFSGLFNFMLTSPLNDVKVKLLELIKSYMLKLHKEVILSLPGLMLCIIPTLDDTDEIIRDKAESILKEIERIVGTSNFFGEVWKAMLRTPRARPCAIRYLSVNGIPSTLKQAKNRAVKNQIFPADFKIKIAKGEIIVDEDPSLKEEDLKRIEDLKAVEVSDIKEEELKRLYFYFFYPRKNELAINALISGLTPPQGQDGVKNFRIVRDTLNFLISHMPIQSHYNKTPELVRLGQSVILLWKANDFVTQKKIPNWFFAQYDEDEGDYDAQDHAIQTIVMSLRTLF